MKTSHRRSSRLANGGPNRYAGAMQRSLQVRPDKDELFQQNAYLSFGTWRVEEALLKKNHKFVVVHLVSRAGEKLRVNDQRAITALVLNERGGWDDEVVQSFSLGGLVELVQRIDPEEGKDPVFINIFPIRGYLEPELPEITVDELMKLVPTPPVTGGK